MVLSQFAHNLSPCLKPFVNVTENDQNLVFVRGDLSLFQTIYNLSDNVMFVGDFNSKSEAFGCASKNDSGPILKTIQNTLDLIYLNNTEHMYMDWRNGNTDILDMAFITQNLIIHDAQFQIGVDLGSNNFSPIFHKFNPQKVLQNSGEYEHGEW